MLGRYRESLKGDRRHLFDSYRFVDMARKVVGVGSVGTRAWVALMVGRDEEDPLFLQAKEAEASVLQPYTGASGFANHGERVVEGQRLMQASSDILLGWRPASDGRKERDYYVRQSGTGSVGRGREPAPKGREIYGRDAAHPCPSPCPLRRSHRHRRLPRQRRRFDQAIREFAERYADQNELDYAPLVDAAKSGRIEVETDLA